MSRSVCLITNIPTPYRIPLFNLLNERLRSRGFDFEVVFLASSYERRKWKFDENEIEFRYHFLDSRRFEYREGMFSFGFGVLGRLILRRPSIVIAAGFSVPSVLAAIYARLFSADLIVWSGDTFSQTRLRSMGFLSGIVRRFIASTARCGICYGSQAVEYLNSIGVRKAFYAINTVDTEFIFKNVQDLRAKKESLLLDNNLRGRNILFLAYLYQRKGVFETIAAFERLSNLFDENIHLHIVGDGEERDAVERLIESKGLKNVHIWGFKQKAELPFFFAISDLFIFASLDELWGLVLNEALSAGLPVLATKFAGATADLVVDGYNGFVIDPTNPDDIVQKSLLILRDQKLWNAMSKNATTTIQSKATLGHSVNGFVEAVDFVLEGRTS